MKKAKTLENKCQIFWFTFFYHIWSEDLWKNHLLNIYNINLKKKIIDDYKLFYGEKSLSRSVCYKILDECSASFSKYLQGLDNMMADGMYAFENLEKTLNSLCNFLYDETEKINSLISIL